MSYSKLFSEIVMSTIWREPNHIRILWITMLACCDKYHVVNASIPGLADAARISIPQCEEGLKSLLSPDPYSRTQEHEGRRIEKVDGGWCVLNRDKYQKKMSLDDRRNYNKIKQREYREKAKKENKTCIPSVPTSTECTHIDIDVDIDVKDQDNMQSVDADVDTLADDLSTKPKNAVIRIPYQDVVDLYHEMLPTLPQCRKLTSVRKCYIKGRWIEDKVNDLDNWRNFFTMISHSPFLMGKRQPMDGRPPFVATLEWITKPANFYKISEGNYHRG